MKITKQRLKEIIKEELASMEEAVPSIHRAKPVHPHDPSNRAHSLEVAPGQTWTASDQKRFEKERAADAARRARRTKRRSKASQDVAAHHQRASTAKSGWPENVKDPDWRATFGVPKHFTDEEAVAYLNRHGENPRKSYNLRAPTDVEKRNYPHLGDGRYDKYFPPERSWAKKLFGIKEESSESGESK